MHLHSVLPFQKKLTALFPTRPVETYHFEIRLYTNILTIYIYVRGFRAFNSKLCFPETQHAFESSAPEALCFVAYPLLQQAYVDRHETAHYECHAPVIIDHYAVKSLGALVLHDELQFAMRLGIIAR